MNKQDYLRLRYPVRIVEDETGTFFVEIPDLPGCMTVVERFEEAHDAIEGVKEGWIELALEDGQEIPLPSTQKSYSGKFTLRMPRSLHEDLVEQAGDEGVSLNQWCIYLLSRKQKAVETEELLKSLGSKVDHLITCKTPLPIHGGTFLIEIVETARRGSRGGGSHGSWE